MDYIPIPKFASGYSGNDFAGFSPDAIAAMQKFNPDFAKASQDELQNQMKKGEGGSYSASNSMQHTEPTGEAKKSAAYINAFNEEQAFWRDQQNRYLSGDPTNVIDRMTFNDQTALATQLPGRSFLNGGVYIDSSGRQQNAPIRTMPAPKDTIAVNQSTYDAMQGSMNVSADNKYAPASGVPKVITTYVTPNVAISAKPGETARAPLSQASSASNYTALLGTYKTERLKELVGGAAFDSNGKVVFSNTTPDQFSGNDSYVKVIKDGVDQVLPVGGKVVMYGKRSKAAGGKPEVLYMAADNLDKMPPIKRQYFSKHKDGYIMLSPEFDKARSAAIDAIANVKKGKGDVGEGIMNATFKTNNGWVNAVEFLQNTVTDFNDFLNGLPEVRDWLNRGEAKTPKARTAPGISNPNEIYKPGNASMWVKEFMTIAPTLNLFESFKMPTNLSGEE